MNGTQPSLSQPSPQQPSPQPTLQPSQTPPNAPAGSFWNKYGAMIIRLVIVVVIIGAAVLYSRSQTQPANNAANVSNTPAELPVTPGGSTSTVQVSPTPVSPEPAGGTATLENNTVTVTAARGEGYTHTARRALAEYLKANPNSALKAEHKIYIEDYLRKHIQQSAHLYTGSTVDYSEDLIKQAVDAASHLTDRQIQNLHQYAVLVPNL